MINLVHAIKCNIKVAFRYIDETLADCRVIQQHMLIGPGVGATTNTGAKRLLREVIHYKRNPHPEVEIYPSEDR